MRKTKLYKDITTDKIYTFAEVKNAYEIANDCEIEIDNDSMIQIINENVFSVGGNIQIITSYNDEVLAWCNDYAKHMEADRGMAQDEIDESVKELYTIIQDRDFEYLQSCYDNLYFDDEEDSELLRRLNKLLSK